MNPHRKEQEVSHFQRLLTPPVQLRNQDTNATCTMTFYTTKNLLDECSKTRWAKFKIKNRSERMDVVSDIFDSLDGWVDDRMQKLKGARIPNFGTFTWRNRTSAVTGSTTHIKPMFVPDETFVKNVGVPFRLFVWSARNL